MLHIRTRKGGKRDSCETNEMIDRSIDRNTDRPRGWQNDIMSLKTRCGQTLAEWSVKPLVEIKEVKHQAFCGLLFCGTRNQRKKKKSGTRTSHTCTKLDDKGHLFIWYLVRVLSCIEWVSCWREILRILHQLTVVQPTTRMAK